MACASENGAIMTRILTNGVCTAVQSEPSDPALALWLLFIPGAHPFWQSYLLSIVHLRPLPGGDRPAKLVYPEAAYEMVVVALDPALHPEVNNPKTWSMLSPVNIVH
jgi:hypothetical protein